MNGHATNDGPSLPSARSPSEFNYWANVGRPWVRVVRAMGRVVLGFDPAPSDEIVRTFASSYYEGDPLAEAFVEEIYLGCGVPAGRAMLDQALAQGVDSVKNAPASLLRLFADIDADPAWLDPALLERGARVFRRYGSAVFRFAGAITLEGYSQRPIAKPLALTGGYA